MNRKIRDDYPRKPARLVLSHMFRAGFEQKAACVGVAEAVQSKASFCHDKLLYYVLMNASRKVRAEVSCTAFEQMARPLQSLVFDLTKDFIVGTRNSCLQGDADVQFL